MPKIVIQSKKVDLEIGKMYQGIASGPWCEPEPRQWFRVVAKSTAQEWIECLVSFGSPRDHAEQLVCINGPWYYYEIQTD